MVNHSVDNSAPAVGLSLRKGGSTVILRVSTLPRAPGSLSHSLLPCPLFFRSLAQKRSPSWEIFPVSRSQNLVWLLFEDSYQASQYVGGRHRDSCRPSTRCQILREGISEGCRVSSMLQDKLSNTPPLQQSAGEPLSFFEALWFWTEGSWSLLLLGPLMGHHNHRLAARKVENSHCSPRYITNWNVTANMHLSLF